MEKDVTGRMGRAADEVDLAVAWGLIKADVILAIMNFLSDKGDEAIQVAGAEVGAEDGVLNGDAVVFEESVKADQAFWV
jgi:hypothetical protein